MSSALVADLVAAADPVMFAAQLGFECDGWQADVLRSPAPNVMMLCHRQAGKSTIAAIAALHTATYQPGALVLLLSASHAQSIELFEKVTALYRKVDRRVDAEAQSALALRLANGSRIIALPANDDTVRGYSGPSLVVLDEAARIEDSLYFSVRPMVAVSKGRILALSTPAGRRGWFFGAWVSEYEPWHRFELKATDSPRLTAEQLAAERLAMGESQFRQEFLCSFEDNDQAAFRSRDVEAAYTEEVDEWNL